MLENNTYIDNNLLTEMVESGTVLQMLNTVPEEMIMPVEKVCVICGKSFQVPPCRAKTASTCSNECAITVRAKSRERKLERTCLNCGKKYEIPQSHIDRRIYCSNECRYGSVEWRANISEATAREKNPMWKGGEVAQSNGYVYKKSYDHPFTNNNYILKHRYTMEKWLREDCPESEFLVKYGDNLYLSDEAIVHHLDRDKKNNRRRNLIVCTFGGHIKIHRGVMPDSGTYWPPWAKITVGRNKPFS